MNSEKEGSGILIGGAESGKHVSIINKMANRHGLIAGATGTGKTVSMQLLAEGFAQQGVPVFTADVKGDLSGVAKEITLNDKVNERLDKIKIDGYSPRAVSYTHLTLPTKA